MLSKPIFLNKHGVDCWGEPLHNFQGSEDASFCQCYWCPGCSGGMVHGTLLFLHSGSASFPCRVLTAVRCFVWLCLATALRIEWKEESDSKKTVARSFLGEAVGEGEQRSCDEVKSSRRLTYVLFTSGFLHWSS